jgi:hypothetical protein
MEKMAEYILNGEGGKLIDRKSQQADVQSFLDNVANYMVNKITTNAFKFM